VQSQAVASFDYQKARRSCDRPQGNRSCPPLRHIVGRDMMPVAYDSQTALVVVDLQNDFVDPAGSLFVPGADRLVEAANAEIRDAREAGALVVYTQDWHPAQTPHFVTSGGRWPVHCVAGSWGAQFQPGLTLEGEVVRKGTGGEDGYSAFSVRDPATGRTTSTELEALLRRRGIERVVVIGVATDYCVRESALDALRLGFDVSVMTSAVRAVDEPPGTGDAALAELAAAGAHLVP
jgi:nicotinamidase/pyrazinamidase